MRFSTSKYELLLQDRFASIPELKKETVCEVVNCIDHFTYQGSLISTEELVYSGISTMVQKVYLYIPNITHLSYRRDIHLRIEGQEYWVEVHSILLCRCERWSLKVDDIYRLLKLDHGYLLNVAGVCWDHWISILRLEARISGVSPDVVNFNRLRRLGRVFLPALMKNDD